MATPRQIRALHALKDFLILKLHATTPVDHWDLYEAGYRDGQQALYALIETWIAEQEDKDEELTR